ncbi:MAG: hypothetical protein ACI3XI_01875 [Eubacteriales bacterium]
MFTEKLFKARPIIKLAALLLILTFCMGCLFGCVGNKAPDETEAGAQTTAQQDETNDLKSVAEKKYYVISALTSKSVSKNDVQTLAVEYKWKENAMISDGFHCEFDGNGFLTKESVYDSYVNGYEYKYDQNGNMTEQIGYGSDGIVLLRVEYKYDQNGNKTEVIRYGPNGFADHYEYKYDQSGKMTEEIGYKEDGSVCRRAEFEYDQKGNRTKKNCFNPDGSASGYVVYKYDKNGNMTERTSYNAQNQMYEKNTYEWIEATEAQYKFFERYSQ